MHPGVNGRIEVRPGAGPADRRALEDEERDRQESDRRHLLIDVLRDGIDRSGRYYGDHEHGRDRAQRGGDRPAGEHNEKRGAAVEEPDGRGRHSGALDGISARRICIASCTARSAMPTVISEYGFHSGGPHVDSE
jgi:hypothetical protein